MPAEPPFPLWSPTIPFPSQDEMEDLDVVTHVAIERAQPDGYHYLHEPDLAWHHDTLYLCWANHRTAEVNVKDELIRGRTSRDGLAWSAATTWVSPPMGGADSFNHPVLASHDDRLWGFFTRWDYERPSSQICLLDEQSGQWDILDAQIPGFLPFTPPLRMGDGNWILGGELYWFEPAVAVSHGDDFTRWDVVPIDRGGLELIFPETTLIDQGDRLIAVLRPKHTATAPVSLSTDCGRSWTTLALSNFPLAASQPHAGLLSTGQHYLITGNREVGRTLLQIAVTEPGGREFVRVWKIRHQQWPKVRLFGGWGEGSRVGMPTEWSYPTAVEHDGNLYVAYTQGKEDCALSIIPVRVLAV